MDHRSRRRSGEAPQNGDALFPVHLLQHAHDNGRMFVGPASRGPPRRRCAYRQTDRSFRAGASRAHSRGGTAAAPRPYPLRPNHWPRSRSIRRFSLPRHTLFAGPRTAPQRARGTPRRAAATGPMASGPSSAESAESFSALRVAGPVWRFPAFWVLCAMGPPVSNRGIGLFRNSSVRARRWISTQPSATTKKASFETGATRSPAAPSSCPSTSGRPRRRDRSRERAERSGSRSERRAPPR